ncbi:unnamed protein product [Medioppia subpectinata]|uniref:Uncharacterized protein n=1 Tax=Medioppia subpectinata TaxID=1979941 RepID=A0A7R9LSR4_9ACAR|nr:unnamed protein product [Medioppia subpectinata]CAG2121407.1 unnamed protein product [Medioppia subpectinata]
MWKFSPILVEAPASRNQSHGTTPVFYDSRRNPYHLPQSHISSHQTVSTGPAQLSSPLTQCFWTFFWLAIMLFIAIPIGLISCQLYVLLSPISAFITCFAKVTDFLLRLSHMPLGCAQNMVNAKPLCSL